MANKIFPGITIQIMFYASINISLVLSCGHTVAVKGQYESPFLLTGISCSLSLDECQWRLDTAGIRTNFTTNARKQASVEIGVTPSTNIGFYTSFEPGDKHVTTGCLVNIPYRAFRLDLTTTSSNESGGENKLRL